MNGRLIAIAEFIKAHPDCTIDDIKLSIEGCQATIYNNKDSLIRLGIIREFSDTFGVTRYIHRDCENND
jgi:hypothetical protein